MKCILVVGVLLITQFTLAESKKSIQIDRIDGVELSSRLDVCNEYIDKLTVNASNLAYGKIIIKQLGKSKKSSKEYQSAKELVSNSQELDFLYRKMTKLKCGSWGQGLWQVN